MSDNYADETKPLFKLLRTEAFRFVIVRYNHFSLVQQLEKDLKSLFPNRPLQKVDAQKSDYQRISKDYFSLENGFFFIQNFDSLLKEDKDRFGKETPQMKIENERRRHITAGLNLRRDKLAKYPIALFVFLPARRGELYAKIIMEKMPDLWSFRSLILDLETKKVSDKGKLKENTMQLVGNVSNTTNADKNNQAKELNRLLSLLKKTPKNEIAYRLTLYPQIVDIAIALGNYKEALSMLNTWEKQANDNDKGEIWLKKGEILPDMGNFDEAQRQLEKALTFFDKSHNSFKLALTFFRIGNTFGKQGDYVEAIASFEKAIALKPDFYEAFSNMGLSYGLKGESIKAIERYEQVIAIKPDFYEALNDMGFLYALQGENTKAIEYYEKVIEIKPDYLYPYGNLGFIYIKIGSFNKAETILLKAIELGDMTESQMNLGHVYLCKNEEEKAIECYKISLSHFENKDNFWKGMKDDYQYLVQYGITEAYYQSVLEKIS
jgi:tetratricopeptide (TPR) repeat protein